MIQSSNSIKKCYFIYFLSLFPLILFGIYKNGISLYLKDYVSLYGAIKPLLFIIIGFIIGSLVNYIYEVLIKKKKAKLVDIIFSSFHSLYGVLVACIISINTNIILFSTVTFIVLLVSKFIKINKINYIALTSLIIFFIMNLFNEFSFLNNYEASNNFNMNALDYLLGKGSGGIFTTNVLLLIISFIVLYNFKIYKRNIPIFATITFSILTIIYCLIMNDISNIMNMLFTNGILFSFVFIATDSVSSSYTKKGIVIYGIIVGLLTFLLYLVQPALSSLGAILIASICNSFIDLKFE
ncbi:MAG: RnfABCDGE type electron transport complex subunit D [Bacilli bacterium]|nr:RnfABCDGE type electron transport complex subunit D [Bacilli bacterium]